mmetsp:Transcript_43946/g.89735  ORF Transcript_43946/g.89735 Transcript_43946/m.89735 type:complete len:109 (-) Transcript_43946:117-443(-)|eukprot:CAMPEP_0181305350 /NCGR_PEP_ID=MMETSP1101-20121128/9678_1 /TAXON_ID=46948 /ORGANISM="Rhodomonas abbreviata, Strain Caron Lab Isolate" /LENGTH=108 /DNA_ID=CAMNT_0023411251 /DNA_START=99 /DNA_END=425 /DNA_ORIENTATION=+
MYRAGAVLAACGGAGYYVMSSQKQDVPPASVETAEQKKSRVIRSHKSGSHPRVNAPGVDHKATKSTSPPMVETGEADHRRSVGSGVTVESAGQKGWVFDVHGNQVKQN